MNLYRLVAAAVIRRACSLRQMMKRKQRQSNMFARDDTTSYPSDDGVQCRASLNSLALDTQPRFGFFAQWRHRSHDALIRSDGSTCRTSSAPRT